jgi:hypothetical protein
MTEHYWQNWTKTNLNLNVSMVKSEMRDKGGIDAATLAKNWGIGIEAAKRTQV